MGVQGVKLALCLLGNPSHDSWRVFPDSKSSVKCERSRTPRVPSDRLAGCTPSSVSSTATSGARREPSSNRLARLGIPATSRRPLRRRRGLQLRGEKGRGRQRWGISIPRIASSLPQRMRTMYPRVRSPRWRRVVRAQGQEKRSSCGPKNAATLRAPQRGLCRNLRNLVAQVDKACTL